jgi:hypothetical protein
MVVSRILQTSKKMKMKMNKVVSKKHRKLLKKQYVVIKTIWTIHIITKVIIIIKMIMILKIICI